MKYNIVTTMIKEMERVNPSIYKESGEMAFLFNEIKGLLFTCFVVTL